MFSGGSKGNIRKKRVNHFAILKHLYIPKCFKLFAAIPADIGTCAEGL